MSNLFTNQDDSWPQTSHFHTEPVKCIQLLGIYIQR